MKPSDLSVADSERAVLSVLINAAIDGDGTVKDKCLKALQPEAFVGSAHRLIYKIIIENGVLLDLAGVWREIENKDFTSQVDKKYLMNVAAIDAGKASIDYHIEQINKASQARLASQKGERVMGVSKRDVASRVREYLLEELDGGTFKVSDLKRELGLNDDEYVLARQCVRRMVGKEIEKHGHTMGVYRVVDRKKEKIDWDSSKADSSQLKLPGNLHQIVTVRDGDLIAFAAYKNHSKTAVAIECGRLNLENFIVHFFITEYQDRMKRRLLDFGIDLNHPNLHCYQIAKSDYIPDKIESGPGVLNIIDHYPNLDNFYLVGKHQDEIHRCLNGAICIITHQKLKPDDKDAVGGSFWTGTPALAVTLFQERGKQYERKMMIRKGKEPAPDKFDADGLELQFNLRKGCRFEYDPNGWK